MTLLQELREFLRTLTDWVLLLIVFTLFFFTCNVESVTVFGKVTQLPVPTAPSFAADFFTALVQDLVPPGVPLVVTSPMTAFVVQAKLAFLLALFFTAPVFMWRLTAFLAPALHTHERRLLQLLLTPLTLLFLGGVYFAHSYVVPITLTFLYTFAAPLGVVPFLSITEFIGVIMSLMLFTGLAFTLPVFMVVLTRLGAVSASFWWANARYAFVLFLITSAIITPDGSGVSMVLLSVPISVLYGAGILVCIRIQPKPEQLSATQLSMFTR